MIDVERVELSGASLGHLYYGNPRKSVEDMIFLLRLLGNLRCNVEIIVIGISGMFIGNVLRLPYISCSCVLGNIVIRRLSSASRCDPISGIERGVHLARAGNSFYPYARLI